MSGAIRWVRPPADLARAVELYGDRVIVAIQAVAGRIATLMETDAKAAAPWTDRTGNARTGLFGTSERDAARKLVTIYLSHGPDIDYGVYLELAHGGTYQVVEPTIERHLPELMADLQALLA